MSILLIVKANSVLLCKYNNRRLCIARNSSRSTAHTISKKCFSFHLAILVYLLNSKMSNE